MIRLAGMALLSHWRRRPVQLVTLLGGLILATALWSGVQALNAEARSSYAASAEALGQDQYARLTPRPGARITWEAFATLRRAGWQVSPVVDGTLRRVDGTLRLLGVDPLTSPPRPGLSVIASGEGDIGTFLQEPGVLLAGPDTLPLIDDTLPPALLAPDLPAGLVVTDVSTAMRLLGITGFDHLVILPDQPLGLPEVSDITTLIRTEPDAANDIAALTDSFHLNLTAFGFLSFAVGLFIVQSAIGLAFEQRRGTLRTLRALGVPLRAVLIAFALELSLFAVVAGIIGLGLGFVVAGLLMPGVSGTLQGLYGAAISGQITFDPIWALAGLAMTLAGTALAGFQVFLKVARLPLLASANAGAWAQSARQTIKLQALAAGLLLSVALILAVLGDSLLAGFACLAALLLGAALALPGIAALLLSVIARFMAPGLPQWSIADTRQHIPGLSLAMMALMLALSANIGVGTMVGSFRATFLGWLDQRLASELYVTARTPAEADAIRETLTQDPNVTAILPIWSVPLTFFGQEGQGFGVVPHETYSRNWPLLTATQNVWEDLHQGQGVLVNEQMFRRQNLTLGATLSVTPDWQPLVIGVYSDYGNTRPQIMADSDTLASKVVQPDILRFAVRVAPNYVSDLAEKLRKEFALSPMNVVDQSRVKSASITVFERTFLVTGALNVLTLAVAGFALWMSLLTLADLRLPQVAPVWAIGLAPARLARLDVLRTLVLAGVTWVLAIPVGLGLAWVLLSVVNVQAFGWKLPMQLFPVDWVWLGFWALIATVLASLWPAYALARAGAFRLLRVFSQNA